MSKSQILRLLVQVSTSPKQTIKIRMIPAFLKMITIFGGRGPGQQRKVKTLRKASEQKRIFLPIIRAPAEMAGEMRAEYQVEEKEEVHDQEQEQTDGELVL